MMSPRFLKSIDGSSLKRINGRLEEIMYEFNEDMSIPGEIVATWKSKTRYEETGFGTKRDLDKPLGENKTVLFTTADVLESHDDLDPNVDDLEKIIELASTYDGREQLLRASIEALGDFIGDSSKIVIDLSCVASAALKKIALKIQHYENVLYK